MGIIAKSSGENFENELLPAGSHIAVCYGMIDMGTQETTFNGEKKQKRQVRIVWELSELKKVFDESKGEEPFSAGKTFTLSMSDKASLRKFIEGWRGKGYTKEEAEAVDITVLLGVPCMLNIVNGTNQEGKEYASIASAAMMHKSIPKPQQHNPSYFFSLDEFDQAKYDSLHKWLQEKIALSPEYQAIKNPVKLPASQTPAPVLVISNDDDDTIPF